MSHIEYSALNYYHSPVSDECLCLGVLFHNITTGQRDFKYISNFKRFQAFDDEADINFVRAYLVGIKEDVETSILNYKDSFDLHSYVKVFANEFRFSTIKKLNDKNGVNYINAVFYGEPGDRLYLGCNDTYHTFIENTLELNLYLEDLFLPEYEFRESTVNANLNASYVRENKKYAYNISSFEMNVPPAEFELLSPSEQTVKAYRDKYEIKLWTTTDSKVFLNNNNITSYMDGTCNITFNIDVKEDSSTTYQIEIVQPYHTPKSEVFIISRDALKVDLSIATSSASVIHEKSIVISGSTEPNAEITSNLPILQLDKNDLYNTFTATLDLSGQTYGQLEAMITATNEKGSSTKSHVFWYWPAESAITSSASAFNSAIASDPATYRGRNILISSAKVVRNVSANKFEVVCTYNDIEYNLIIDYPYKQINITVDSSYRIFAAVDGTVIDGKPVFRAWYIYNA